MKKRTYIWQTVIVLGLVVPVFIYLFLNPVPAKDVRPSLEGNWRLVEMNGESLSEGTNISLDFIDSTGFGGFGGCNHYGGAYSLSPDQVIVIKEIEANAQACIEPAGVLDQENLYFETFLAIRIFEIEDGFLTFRSEDGLLQLVYMPDQPLIGESQSLDGSSWVLGSIDGEVVDSGAPVRIRFDKEVFGGFSGCRHFSGTYLLEKERITLTGVRMFEMMCPFSDATKVENRFLDSLDLFKQFSITETDLEVVLHTGKVLEFMPAPISKRTDISLAETALKDFFGGLVSLDYKTAAALYGGPAEFIEILREANPDVLQDDLAQLLANACLNQFRCMPLHEVISGQYLTERAILFTVVFENPDGSPFKFSTCCGGVAPATDSPTEYDFLVIEDLNGFEVFGQLIYVP